MIYITNIRKCKSIPNATVYAIVRSMKNPIAGIEQLSILSPSTDLFWKYLDLKKAGKWNKESFDAIYTPAFLKQMEGTLEQSKCKELTERSKTEDIVLCCYCTDLCHRFLVADILKNRYGAEIKIM